MGWMQQKKPNLGNSKNFYTLGLNKTVLIVGLGNIGKKYELTRHNVGFSCIDEFVSSTDEMTDFVTKKDLNAEISTGTLGGIQVIAIKPTTYMNLSGAAVTKVANFYKVSLENTIVIHDDLDIKFGQIRMRVGGSSGGHNGIKSVSQSVGEEYGRVRIGVGPKYPEQIEIDDFVLQKFSKEEQSQLKNMKREILAIIQEFIFGNSLPSDTRSFLL